MDVSVPMIMHCKVECVFKHVLVSRMCQCLSFTFNSSVQFHLYVRLYLLLTYVVVLCTHIRLKDQLGDGIIKLIYFGAKNMVNLAS